MSPRCKTCIFKPCKSIEHSDNGCGDPCGAKAGREQRHKIRAFDEENTHCDAENKGNQFGYCGYIVQVGHDINSEQIDDTQDCDDADSGHLLDSRICKQWEHC